MYVPTLLYQTSFPLSSNIFSWPICWPLPRSSCIICLRPLLSLHKVNGHVYDKASAWCKVFPLTTNFQDHPLVSKKDKTMDTILCIAAYSKCMRSTSNIPYGWVLKITHQPDPYLHTNPRILSRESTPHDLI